MTQSSAFPARQFKGLVLGRDAARFSPLVSALLAVPLLAALSLGFVYPVAKLVSLSLTNGGETYRRIWDDPLYVKILLDTLATAAMVTGLCLMLGYPVAIAMAKLRAKFAFAIAACVFVPLWTSVLIRSYAWIILLQRNGPINNFLRDQGLIDGPLKLLYTHGAVLLGMTHVLLPFAILPIFATLKTLSPDFGRAAANLGANTAQTFLRIILPLSLPGVFAGGLLCFVLALGFYITPALLGGPSSMLMATLIGQQTTVLLDWPFAASLSTVLLAVTLIIVLLFRKALSLNKGFHSVR
ncbi:ABC transporter permease [Rhizobium glycinendophyticum]|uniref:ABC transporter permease n=1 Tax=Rhizobium glycinendophyticum TaxID=2589807 RepID=A0A504TT72_9HYPH|nr:ABC transporter permease [Rhizobium glycinendophyticum]TPP04590.1 ABC transporter permease [Rhizobium glycinendophyticum]